MRKLILILTTLLLLTPIVSAVTYENVLLSSRGIPSTVLYSEDTLKNHIHIGYIQALVGFSLTNISWINILIHKDGYIDEYNIDIGHIAIQHGYGLFIYAFGIWYVVCYAVSVDIGEL